MIRAAGAAVVAALLCGSANAAPPRFSATIANPWFPLKAGVRFVYEGEKDGLPSRDIVTVTHDVLWIDGAPCAVVDDRLYLRGKLRERTTDYYSQDAQGNVWYFGENTAELDARGRVTSTEGTWKAGVHGAKPGIFMPAHPRLHQSGRQEYYQGHADDHFEVIGLFGGNTLLTKEWTPLEPGTLDHKLYVRGVGDVLEHTERGGNEHAELVAVIR